MVAMDFALTVKTHCGRMPLLYWISSILRSVGQSELGSYVFILKLLILPSCLLGSFNFLPLASPRPEKAICFGGR